MKLCLFGAIAMFAFLLSSCATLIPERHNANLLIGKNISESYQYFGVPFATFIDNMNGPRTGERVFIFKKSRGFYSYDKQVGSAFDVGPGGVPTITNYVARQTREVACNTSLWVNQNGVIDYYEIGGNCGIGGIGLGNTGALHQKGIN